MAEHDSKHDEHAGAAKGRGSGGGAHGGGGDHEEHEGAPEWLISFADNVALLMGFFVILLAMNMKEPTTGGVGGKEDFPSATDRELDLIIGIREAFNTPIDMDSADPHEGALARRKRERLGESLQPGDHGSQKESQAIRPTDFSSLGGTVPFGDDAAALSPRGRAMAEEIGRRVRGLRWVIEVRGHASPSETFQDFDRGMSLSFQRARAVAEELIAQGVRPEHLRLVAAGDTERRVPMTFERATDSINQRVDVVVSGTQAADDPHAGGPPPEPRPVPAAPPAPGR
jgi:flagellar motor protein MotB